MIAYWWCHKSEGFISVMLISFNVLSYLWWFTCSYNWLRNTDLSCNLDQEQRWISQLVQWWTQQWRRRKAWKMRHEQCKKRTVEWLPLWYKIQFYLQNERRLVETTYPWPGLWTILSYDGSCGVGDSAVYTSHLNINFSYIKSLSANLYMFMNRCPF